MIQSVLLVTNRKYFQPVAKENDSYCEETGQTLSSASRWTNSRRKTRRRKENGGVQMPVKIVLHPPLHWRVLVAAAAEVALVWTHQHLKLSGDVKSDHITVNR